MEILVDIVMIASQHQTVAIDFSAAHPKCTFLMHYPITEEGCDFIFQRKFTAWQLVDSDTTAG